MERILRILLLITMLGGGDAILRNEERLLRRYGGGGSRRPHSPYNSYENPGALNYPYSNNNNGGSQFYGSTSYNSPSYQSNEYNSPYKSHLTIPSGQPYDVPSVSYQRPFGLPERQKFPYGGYTYKLPEEPAVRPPIKSTYKSKPYPDFIVRFKPYSHPAEVTVHPRPLLGGQPPALPTVNYQAARPTGDYPPPPVYQPPQPSQASIPVYHDGGSKGVNVGAHILAANQYGANGETLHSPPIYGNIGGVQTPPQTAVYIISDKLENGSFDLVSSSLTGSAVEGVNQAEGFVPISNVPAFGASKPGIIKPVKPSVVYEPPKGEQLNHFLFGPVFYPKEKSDTGITTNDTVGSSALDAHLKSQLSVVPATSAGVAPSNASNAIPTVPATTAVPAVEHTKTAASDGKSNDTRSSSVDDEEEDLEEEDDPPPSRESIIEGGRRVINIIKELFKPDDQDSSDRVDDTPGGSESADGDEEHGSEDSVVENSESAQSDKSGSRHNTNRRKPDKVSSSNTGNRRKSSSRGTVKSKNQQSIDKTTVEISDPSQSIEDQYQQPQMIPGGEPIIGQLQLGFLGPPPPGSGSGFHQQQPFFYPSGVQIYSQMPQDEDSNPSVSNEESGAGENDHTQRIEVSDSSTGDHQTGPAEAHPQPQDPLPSDLSMAPQAEAEQPQPYEPEVVSNRNDQSNNNNNDAYQTDYDHQSYQDQVPSSYFSNHRFSHGGHLHTDYHGQDATEDPRYQTYPQTNSYPGDETTHATAYADSYSVDGEQQAPSPYVDQDISASSTDHTVSGHHLDDNTINSDVTIHVDASTPLYDYNSQYEPTESPIGHDQTDQLGSDSASNYVSNSYSSVSRKPYRFPEFLKGSSYIPPTTYRPSYARLPATSSTDDASVHDDSLAYNSVIYDEDKADDHLTTTTVSPANDLSDSYSLDTANSETQFQVQRAPLSNYGTRLSSK